MSENESIISEKISYWQYIWTDLIENFNKNNYGLELVNPGLILMDIIIEIEYNQFRNKANKKYFYDQLDYFFKNDLVIINHYRSDFIILKRDFYKKDNNTYIHNLCLEILRKFKNGDYFNKAFQFLRDILLNPSWANDDEENIRNISQSVIVEFVIKGYSFTTIKKFVSDIFDDYSFTKGGLIYSNFPHCIDPKSFYAKGNLDQQSYNEAVIKKIDSLTISDRIAGLINYFNKEYKECFFIFFISGLKGDIDITLGDVNFYSPNVKKYIKKSRFGTKKESEAINIEGEECLLNCAVKIRHLDIEITKSNAIEKIEKGLSLMHLYLPIKKNIQILKEKYFIVNLDGELIGKGVSTENSDFYKWMTSYNLNTKELEYLFNNRLIGSESDFIFTPSDNKKDIEQKIIDSTLWYRKAKETNRGEDKLLNYWICIENIMNFKSFAKSESYENAKEFLPYLRVYDYASRLARDLYDFIRKKIMLKENIPDEILEKCNLNTEQGLIDLKPFIQNLDLLENSINSRAIRRQIKFVRRFFNDNKYAKHKIMEEINKVETDILLIYRLRNQIVHNAGINSKVLPYYIQKAENLAKDLLKEIIHKYKLEKMDNIEDILIEYKIKLNRTLSRLEQGEIISVLDCEF